MPEPTEPTRADNVIEALRRVIEDMPAIGKEGRADPKQGGYAYRGIEQVTVAVQPLLAKHGVVFTPHRILNRETVDIVVNSKPWTDEKLTVLWRVYGPGGRDDYIEIETPAIGRDNSDKGANKCMTQAFKYALLPTLCIADSKDDNDGQTDEAQTAPEPVEYVTQEQADEIKRLGKAIKDAGGDPGGPWPKVFGEAIIVDGQWVIDNNGADELIARMVSVLEHEAGYKDGDEARCQTCGAVVGADRALGFDDDGNVTNCTSCTGDGQPTNPTLTSAT